MTAVAGRYRVPNLVLTALEARAVTEYVGMLASRKLLGSVPKGDGHPVLVLPGFMANDTSTRPLRRFLNRTGYSAHGWGLGRNEGPHPDTVTGLGGRFAELAEDGPVSIIGWSLGGLYARAMARHNPDMVRQVITLVSPFRMNNGDRSRASTLYQSRYVEKVAEPYSMNRRLPLTVPATSIFTRWDGIVDWRACLDDPGPERENIEVRGATHIGIGVHPAALYIIADRLAQPPGEWQPFRIPPQLEETVRVGEWPVEAPLV